MISTRRLTRTYGATTVLDDVSFDVRPGRLTGFVGANGAGKTTTMRIILGVLSPTSGEVLWDGDPITDEDRRSIGYMPEERGLYPKMKVADQLEFFGELHGMTRADARRRVHQLLDSLGLGARADDVLETLSLGNQQRVQVAAALVHHPRALVLDEPFSGLDPVAVEAMVALLRQEVGDDVPVLFSSHQLDLVDRICDDLVVLSRGRLVAAGEAEELRGSDVPRYRIALTPGEDAGWLRDLPGVTVTDVAGPRALAELHSVEADELLHQLVQRCRVTEFARDIRPLTKIFKEAVR